MGELNLRDDRKYWLSPDSEYSVRFDAYYWRDTGEWVEPRCSDIFCNYCGDRPDKKPKDDYELR